MNFLMSLKEEGIKRIVKEDLMIRYKDYKNLLDDFLKIIKKEYKDELISVVLYGSVARGNARKTSDVDLIVVLEDAPSKYYKRSDRLIKTLKILEESKEFLRLKKESYSAYLKPIVFSKSEAEEDRPLFLDLIEDEIILYDREDFFKKRLRSLKKRLEKLGSKRVFLEDGSWYWILKPDLKPGEVFKL